MIADCASRERPGPTILELAEGSGGVREPATDSRDAPNHWEQATEIVSNATRPIVIAGTLAIRLGLADQLADLNIPVFSTAAAKGVVDETLPHAAGVYTGVGLSLTPEAQIVDQADLVIAIGVAPSEVLAVRKLGQKSIALDLTCAAGRDAFLHSAIFDAGRWPDLFEILRGRAWGIDQIEATKDKLDAHLAAGFLPGQVYSALRDRLDPTTTMILDTGNFCTVGEHIWPARSPDTFLMSGQSRYMGTSIPMALGAVLFDRHPTVAIVGDGGIGPFVGELRIAQERSLPLLIILMSDGRFGSIAEKALMNGLALEPVTIQSPSWINVMSGFGLQTERADNLATLETAVEAWHGSQRPTYIEVVFDPNAYVAMLKDVR